MKLFTPKRQFGYLRSAKTIFFGIALAILAGMPLSSDLLPNKVDYKETTKEVNLRPGRNEIGDVVITVDRFGRAVHAERIGLQTTNCSFGFRNFRTFLLEGVPFLSLLGFCVFFFWYDKQPKTTHLLILRRCTRFIFCFVSLWFSYWMVISKPATISYISYSLGIYFLTGVSLALVYCSYRYYCATLRRKHRKIAELISYVFEIRYKHYPRMAHKALYKTEAELQTQQHIQAYELQTFETLANVVPPRPVIKARFYKPKLILIGLILSVLAITPLLYQFASRHVDYSQTTETIRLKPGLNKIGPLRLILGPQGVVIKAQETKRHVVHKVFRFQSPRAFFNSIAPFFASLSLCVFFFWYEQQQKNPHVLALKKYAWTIFLLVSLWCTYWALSPQNDPIPHKFYSIGVYITLCIGVASLQYLKRFFTDKLRWLCAQATSLLLYVFKVKKRHYPRMAIKAMYHAVDYQETRREVEEYDKRTHQVIANSKEFMTDSKLRKEYEDYKQFRLDL